MRTALRTSAALGIVLLLSAYLQAAEPPTAAAERAAALITQLSSPRFEEREAATRALDALGPAALESLRQALQSSDAEVRRRAGPLVRTIERHVAEARILESTRVRLIYQNTPLHEAVTDLARKTGFILHLEGDKVKLAGRRVTLDTGDVTVWEALDRFCQKANLTERTTAGAGQDDRYRIESTDRRIVITGEVRSDGLAHPENHLVLKDGVPAPLPCDQTGAFRIRALPPDTPLTGQTKVEGETLFGLEVRLEPRLQLQSLLALRIDRAVDDRGQTLTQPTVASGTGEFSGNSGAEILIIWDGMTELPANFLGEGCQVPVRLRLPERPGRRLKELHGTIALRVQTAPEPLVTVDGVLQTVGQAVPGGAGSALKVIEVGREEKGEVKLRVEVTPPPWDLVVGGLPARLILSSRWGWRGNRGTPAPQPVGVEQLALLDARGRKIPLASSTDPAVGGNGKTWEFTLVYQPGAGQGEPARLVYTGRRSATVEVPFTLKDVPLP
jgi:hypothetical protein